MMMVSVQWYGKKIMQIMHLIGSETRGKWQVVCVPQINIPVAKQSQVIKTEGKKALKTLWEKEKMLVTSIFSFSPSVLNPSQKEF